MPGLRCSRENPGVKAPPEASASTLFDDMRDAVAAAPADLAAERPLCRNGAVLRALLLVNGVLGLALLHSAEGPLAWVQALAAVAVISVPATLVWVLGACLANPWLVRQSALAQGLLAAGLGGAIAWGVAWPVQWLGLAPAPLGRGLAIAASGAALAGALYQMEQWRQRARLPAAAAARLADLQTRIRPHFLFNTLNTAIALVQLDPRRAEEVLEDLSDLFRAALGALDEATTLDAEIELGRRYLAIEQLRFGARLSVVWDLDPNAALARLPPLALQPLIENAVRHGIEPSAGEGCIEIRTRRRRERVLVSVTNTVPAAHEPPSRPGHGIGLASVRERLRLMHDLESDFRSGLIDDGRYRVSLSVPA